MRGRTKANGNGCMASARKRKNSPADDSAPREHELKLVCNSRDIGHLLHNPVIADAQPLPDSSGILTAIYFDTPDQALRRAGMSLRIREHQGRLVQTIKAEQGPRGVAFDRAEWETEVDGTLDQTAARKTPLQPFVDDEATRVQIRPLFTVRTRRHAFLVGRDNSAIELVLDRTIVAAGERSDQVTEIELELKDGEPRALFLTVKDLLGAAPMRLSMLAKSERGYRLLDAFPAQPVKAAHAAVPAGEQSANAFQMIAAETLSQIVQNEELLRSYGDPEALHQMRVGFRRLRTALSFFKEMLAGSETRGIRKELRRAAKLLAEARDLDVLHQRLHENGTLESSQAALDEVEEQRNRAYATLAQNLDKPRFKKALLRAAIWIEAGTWLTDASARTVRARDRPVEKLARRALARRWNRIRRDAKRIDDLSTEKRHKFRMRIKALRYGSEFFADTFKGRARGSRRKSLLKSLEQLQDILGEMNDLTVRRRLLPSLVDSRAEADAARLQTLMRRAGVAARRLRSAKPFWN
ncbi:CHAD domain-containing protein [Microvirga brassicacearum]|uniref:CHAD domain-containing protein n=1 Tax=Microvirga brassicacearum TaxID=2580413 RepID=A0A5N3PD34_9HYPH|nr:CHAD domain-containing protein [Microvirga brassicacearum]